MANVIKMLLESRIYADNKRFSKNSSFFHNSITMCCFLNQKTNIHVNFGKVPIVGYIFNSVGLIKSSSLVKYPGYRMAVQKIQMSLFLVTCVSIITPPSATPTSIKLDQ
jgi:hypothetical protein